MERLTAGKSRQTVLQAVNSLLPVLLEHWGRPEEFKAAAAEALMKEMDGSPATAPDAGALAEQILTAVMQIRDLRTRHVSDQQTLLQIQKKLEPKFAHFPVRQGCLSLAVRMRQEALSRLDTPEGKTALAKLIAGLDADRNGLALKFKDNDQPSLDRLEAALALMAGEILGKDRDPFLLQTVAGEIVEMARKQARLHPGDASIPADFSDNSPETRIVSTLEDPTRNAELNEARQRFSLLDDYQKAARYEALRKVMAKHIARIAPHGPDGFEVFCRAVESIAFPYPAPLEWTRVFLKPLYANAGQSTLFDKCHTEKSVKYRYQKIQEERGVNPVMLEMARAYALSTLKTVQAATMKNFMFEVNLVGEFNWPTDIEELKKQLEG